MAEALRSLTPKERAVAGAAETGATTKDIAAALFLSPRTVEHHLASIYRKLNLRGRGELIAFLGERRTHGAAQTSAPPCSAPVRYARGSDATIAYQVLGDGPLDLVLVQGLVSNLEVLADDPAYARWVAEIASWSRFILFDKRGTGLSDPISPSAPPSLDHRMDDLRVVMDAAASRRAFILGGSEGAPMSLLFAAIHPDRVRGLILYGGWAARDRPPDHTSTLDQIEAAWGTGQFLSSISPSSLAIDGGLERMARIERFGASPGTLRALVRMAVETDVREILPAIRVPTLVIHRAEDRGVPVEGSRDMAERIPGARYVEVPGEDHYPWYGDPVPVLEAIQAFIADVATACPPDKHAVLTVVAAADEQHLRATFGRLVAGGGRLAAAGQGAVAVFQRTGDALRFAVAAASEVAARGHRPRFGVHIGECEDHEHEVSGPAVETTQAVAALPSEATVLLTRTVRDVARGGGFVFREGGQQIETGGGTLDVLEVV